MAVGQTTFTVANGAVLQLHAGGNMADYLSGDPDATAFRYTSVRFTSFGMAWFFENFDKGAASYLGETLTYTASRNCDIIVNASFLAFSGNTALMYICA